MIGRCRPLLLFLILSVSSTAFSAPGKLSAIEKQLLTKVLRPWVSSHYPAFDFTGEEQPPSALYTWTFKDRNDPQSKNSFPLDIEMNVCETLKTARQSFLPAGSITQELAVPGSVLVNAGDEALGFDIRKTPSHEGHPDWIGGWVRCRVGTLSFFIRSYSVKLEDQIELARHIAAEAKHLPRPPKSVLQKVEAGFLAEIHRTEREAAEAMELQQREEAKEFTTPLEHLQTFLAAHPDYQPKYDDNGVTPGARRTVFAPDGHDSPVTEISLERAGCYGTCPQYAVEITADGRVRYFGRRYVKMLGNHTGQIPTWKFRQIADLVQDSKVMEMHETYEDTSITDQETVYTSFVVSGTRKTISDYASSAPSSLWAIEELIDKLVAETEWEPQKSAKGSKK